MAGLLLVSGQQHMIDLLGTYANSSGLYVGLFQSPLTLSVSDEAKQLPSDIQEISAHPTSSGYERQLVSSWTSVPGVDPKLSGAVATFNVSGTWSAVNGYFVSLGSGTAFYDALWAEVFPEDKRGDKHHGDTVLITPIYEQKADGE